MHAYYLGREAGVLDQGKERAKGWEGRWGCRVKLLWMYRRKGEDILQTLLRRRKATGQKGEPKGEKLDESLAVSFLLGEKPQTPQFIVCKSDGDQNGRRCAVVRSDYSLSNLLTSYLFQGPTGTLTWRRLIKS